MNVNHENKYILFDRSICVLGGEINSGIRAEDGDARTAEEYRGEEAAGGGLDSGELIKIEKAGSPPNLPSTHDLC